MTQKRHIQVWLLALWLAATPAFGQESLDAFQHQVSERIAAGDLNNAASLARQWVEQAAATQGPDHPDTGVAWQTLGAVYANAGYLAESIQALEAALSIYAARLGEGDEQTLTTLKSIADVQSAMGRPDVAVAYLRRRAAAIESTLGDSDAATGQAWSDLAWTQLSAGDAPGAVAEFSRAMEIQASALGEAHLNTATTLAGWAMASHWAGDLAAAESRYQRSRQAFVDSGNAQHPDLAAVVKNQADLLHSTGRIDEALPLYYQAIALWEGALGAEHEVVEGARIALAGVLNAQGDHDGSLEIYRALLEARRNRLGLAHPESLSMAAAAASVHWASGRFEEAEALYTEALAVAGEVPEKATLLDGAAKVDAALGRLQHAESRARQALALAERVAGDQLMRVEPIRIHLATLYRDRGAYDRAEPIYRQALARLEQAGMQGSEYYATVTHEAGMMYAAMGDLDRAESSFRRTLEIYRAVLGENHPFLATALGALAAVQLSREQLEAATESFSTALAIYRDNLGENNVYTARAMGNLAAVYQARELLEEARPLQRQAMEGLADLLGEDHPDTAGYANNYGVLLMRSGAHAEAESVLTDALRRVEAVLGASHPTTTSIRQNLAYLFGILGRTELSLSWFLKTLDDSQETLNSVFAIASERQKLAFIDKTSWGYERMLSLVHRHFADDPTAVRQALDWVLRRKGIVFDAQSRQQASLAEALEAEAPEVRETWNRLLAQRAALAQALLSTEVSDSTAEEIAGLRREIETLEQFLAAHSPLAADELQRRSVAAADVADRLGEGEVLVEFVRFRDVDWAQGRWADSRRYVAFVMRANGEVTLVDLGDAEALDTSVTSLNRSLQADPGTPFGRRRQADAARRLHALVWGPLGLTTDGVTRHVRISPDGLLNLVSFAALEGSEGRFVAEDHMVSYLTSGRDLVRGDQHPGDSDLFLLANPDFGTSSQDGASGFRAGGSAPLAFSPLPGTEREAEGIPAMVGGERQQVVQGSNASESVVLEAGSPRVMHLATHGFFLDGEAVSGIGQALRAAGLEPSYSAIANPLVRSGLALAGANQAGLTATGDDGVLTALEVSALNLHGTDLVALSACDTARGEIRSGEGVFGMRRAFALAGARHLMMSLWPVDDEETAEQMLQFYRNYGQGAAPAKALRQAQLDSIARLRQSLGSAPPSLWAGFIIQGSATGG